MRISAAVFSLVMAGGGTTLAFALESMQSDMDVPERPAIVAAPTNDVPDAEEPGSVETAGEAESCVPPAAAFTDMARRLAGDPEAFVERYTSHGASVAVPLRNAVMAEPNLLTVVIDLIRASESGSERARQLAVGLGQAALLCAATAPNTALRFQEAILKLDDDFLTQNFAAAAGDTGTGSLGVGGGGAGAPGGPGGGGAPGLAVSASLGAFGPWTVGSAPQPDPQFRFGSVRILTIFETSGSSGIVSRTTP